MNEIALSQPRRSLVVRLLAAIGIKPEQSFYKNLYGAGWALVIGGIVAYGCYGTVKDNITNVPDAKVRLYEEKVDNLNGVATSLQDQDRELRTVKLSPALQARVAESKQKLRAQLALMQKELDQPAP
jgi:hypothetical protein